MKTKSYFFIISLFGLVHFSFLLPAKENFSFISTLQLAQDIQEKKVFVVDCNTPTIFQEGHIPSAIHFNSSEADEKLLPQNKNTPLVFYCKNPHCLASHEAARFAKSRGYSNINIYSLGIDGWKAAGMKTESEN